MSGWHGHSSGSGAEHEPSEDRGQAAWGAGETGSAPPWASAETQTGGPLPPPWASAETHTGGTLPTPPWVPPPVTPVYVPAPEPRPRRAARLLLAVTVTVVLGVGGGTGFWYLTRDTAGRSGAEPGTSVTVTTPAASRTATSAPPSASPAAGYRRVHDPLGYALAVPDGWTRRQKQGVLSPVVSYDAPADGRRLQIFRLAEDTPAESLDLAENDPGYGFSHQPGYQVLDRASGAGWAELTYRYDDADIGPRRVVDHRFRVADGTLYAIRSSGPADLAPRLVREPLTTAVGSFCPPGGTCP